MGAAAGAEVLLAYELAYKLKKTMPEILSMSTAEIEGWYAYLGFKADGES